MKQNEQLPEEGAEQRFDPGEKEQELQDRLQGLSEKKYDEREAGLIEARRQLEMKKITRKKFFPRIGCEQRKARPVPITNCRAQPAKT